MVCREPIFFTFGAFLSMSFSLLYFLGCLYGFFADSLLFVQGPEKTPNIHSSMELLFGVSPGLALGGGHCFFLLAR